MPNIRCSRFRISIFFLRASTESLVQRNGVGNLRKPVHHLVDLRREQSLLCRQYFQIGG